MKLTPRQEQILHLIIQLYSQNEEPVGSRTLLENSRLKVSPATIRNDMMALEQLGYLNKAHTSSGRIPSFDGYRFYIDRLIDREDDVNQEDRMFELGLRQQTYDIQHYATRLVDRLSQLTNLPVVLNMKQDQLSRVRDFRLSYHTDTQLIGTLILDQGAVESEIFTLPYSLSANSLEKLQDFLQQELINLPLDIVYQRLQLTLPLRIQQLIGMQLNFASLIQKAIDRHGSHYYHCAGKNQLFDLLDPKNTSTAIKSMFELIDGNQQWLAFLDNLKMGMEVKLDFQAPPYQLKNLALVSAKIQLSGTTLVVALIGPATMAYEKVIQLMHQLMFELTNY